jgi:signal transduction histidine kinase
VAHFIKTKTPKLIGHQTEFLATRKNGERFPLSISFSVSEIDGKFFFTGIIQDLTETKALREQIAKSEQLAALGRLVAEISHEIKNPLVLIGGFARQLLKNAPDEKSQSKLKIISNEVQRLENLLLELREIYRPPNLSIRSININTLLQEMVSLSQENCESKEITLHFQTDQDPLWIKGDPEKLKQVFLNLIKNAIEAMDKGGRLIIRSRLSGDQVEIAVIDNGPGIQPKDQAKLFTPFFTTKQRGTGLGLSVSKKIIEDHSGGSLNLESQEGRGTIVKITLPLTGHQKD